MFDEIQFEISGKCNAFCKYCYTGRCNREKRDIGKFIDADVFKDTIDYLLCEEIINKKTNICLYNYGEPFLHPQLENILQYIDDKQLSYELSTNGSVKLRSSCKKYNLFRYMKNIKFSMCGFSQDSYSRISKLDFERVKQNIVDILNTVRKNGFNGYAIIKFHVYQFNINELTDAIEFARDHNMILAPMFAIHADLEKQIDYIEKKLSIDEMYSISQDMLWYYWKNICNSVKKMTKMTKCPFKETLVIDENLNVLTCCLVTKNCGEGYSRGKLKEINKNDLCQTNSNSDICVRCGNAYIWQVLVNAQSFISPAIMNFPRLSDKKRVVLIGNDSITASFIKIYPHKAIVQCKNASEYVYSKGDYIVFASKNFYEDLSIIKSMYSLDSYYIFNLQIRV